MENIKVKNIDETYARYCLSPNLYDCGNYDPELVKLTETLKSMATEENCSYIKHYHGETYNVSKSDYIRRFVEDYISQNKNGKDNITMVMASGRLEEMHDIIDKSVFSDIGWNRARFNDQRGWVGWPFEDHTGFVKKENNAIAYYSYGKEKNMQLKIANIKKDITSLMNRIKYNRESCFIEKPSHYNGVPVVATYDLTECAEVVEKEGKTYIKIIKDDEVRLGGKNWNLHAGDGFEVKNHDKNGTFSWSDLNFKRGMFYREFHGKSYEYLTILDKVFNNENQTLYELEEKKNRMDEIIHKYTKECYLGKNLPDKKIACKEIINEFCQNEFEDMKIDFEYKLGKRGKKIIYDEVKNELHTLYNCAYEEINAGKNMDDYPHSVCFDLAMNNAYINTPELDDKIFNQIVKNILNSCDPTFEQLIDRFDENHLLDHPEDLKKWNKLDPKIQEEIRGYEMHHERDDLTR